jgi:hypothetical protein
MLKDSAVNMFSGGKDCTVRIEFSNGYALERTKRIGKVLELFKMIDKF